MSHKILVTGAGGFIGGYVVEAALERNYETWAGVRTSTSREYLQDNRIQFVNLDFGNSAHLKEQLQELKSKIGRWDYIVHNLGVTKSKNPDDFDRINYGFLRNFVEALTACDMVPDKFVYMSSLGAWGMGDEKTTRLYVQPTPLIPTHAMDKANCVQNFFSNRWQDFPTLLYDQPVCTAHGRKTTTSCLRVSNTV